MLWVSMAALMALMVGFAVYPQSKKQAYEPIQKPTESVRSFTVVCVKTDNSETYYPWPYDNTPKVGDDCLIYYDGTTRKVARTEKDITELYKAYVRGKIIDVCVGATGAKRSK